MILDATAPHTRVDNFVIDEYGDKIGANGLAIYMVIKRHYNWLTGQCTPSYNRIAEMCRISRSTVIRYIKRLKAFGLIDPQMRFTDEGQTSNQYGFYQKERPKLAAISPGQARGHAANDTLPPAKPAQMDTPAQVSTPVSQGHPPGIRVTLDQGVLNKKEKEGNAKDVPQEEKTQLLKEEKKKCLHPEHEIIKPSNGITICTACYNLLE